MKLGQSMVLSETYTHLWVKRKNSCQVLGVFINEEWVKEPKHNVTPPCLLSGLHYVDLYYVDPFSC